MVLAFIVCQLVQSETDIAYTLLRISHRGETSTSPEYQRTKGTDYVSGLEPVPQPLRLVPAPQAST